ncbi:MAG: hypothetical protein V1644_00970 [Candidatus Micrarchaeota archaeon]
METTRKMEVTDILVLKDLQKHLWQRGIKVTQKTLLTEMVEFVSRKETEFLNFFVKKETQQGDSFDTFLKMKCTGKERTNAVLEHDLIT